MLDMRREKMRTRHGLDEVVHAVRTDHPLCGTQTPRREASNVNVTASGQKLANHSICRISTGQVCRCGYRLVG